MKSTFLKLPEELTGPFTFVDCGSQGDLSNPLINCFASSRFIGFDPGLSESTGVNSSATYFPVAVGDTSATIQFHKTQNPNCSSSYVPNREFLDRFQTVGPFFNVLGVEEIRTISLDEYLPQQGVVDVDFVELDTQGAELSILRGAKDFISNHVLGVRVEVEFSPMYQGQPLFADVDHFMQEHGFMLFDLARYHLKVKNQRHIILGNEQVVWGQALYLKDFQQIHSNEWMTKQKLLKLAVIASYYGFHSHAAEIIETLQMDDLATFSQSEGMKLNAAFASYVSSLQVRFPLSVLRWLMHSPLKKMTLSLFSALDGWQNAYKRIAREQSYFWKD